MGTFRNDILLLLEVLSVYEGGRFLEFTDGFSDRIYINVVSEFIFGVNVSAALIATIYPSRLETRTKESNMYASQRAY